MLSVKYPESHGLDGKVHNIEIKVIQRVRPLKDKNEHTLVYGKENGKNVILDITKDPETGEWLKVPHDKNDYVWLQLCIYRQDLTEELKKELDGKTISNTEEKASKRKKTRPAIEVFVDEHKNYYIMNAAAASIGLLPKKWDMYDYPSHPTIGNLYKINEMMLANLMKYFEVVFRNIDLGLDKPIKRSEIKKEEEELKRVNEKNASIQLQINAKLLKRIEVLMKLPGISPLDSLNLAQYKDFIHKANIDPVKQESLLVSKYVSLGLDDIEDKFKRVKAPSIERLNSRVLIASKLLRLKYKDSTEAREILMDMNSLLSSSYTWEDYEVSESILHTAVEASIGSARTSERNMNLLLSNGITSDGVGCALRVEDLREKKKVNTGEKRL